MNFNCYNRVDLMKGKFFMADEFSKYVSDNLIAIGKKLKTLPPPLAGRAADVDEIVSNTNSPMLIMVMGEFSTGKSTFINALVKRDIATVGAQPTTAVITKLSYGNEDKIEVFFRDGTKKFFGASEFSKLTAESLNKEYDELHAGIDYVSRTLPIEILKNITIIDSPGLNSIKPVHAATTRNFMDKADTVIWLFDANTPTKQTEIDSLKKLNARLTPLVILNKIDAVDEEEEDSVESIIADIERKLRNNKIQVQKIIGVSSKLAFEGARRNNAAMISSSNISEFYNFVNNNIVPNRDAYKKNLLFDEIEKLIGGIYEELQRTNTRNEFLRDENPAAYAETCRNVKELENSLMTLFNLFKNRNGANSNASEEYLFGSFYYNLAEYTNATEKYLLALNHLRKAAKLGHDYAMARIGDMYNLGRSVMQDYVKALEWFTKAADLGNVEALSCLGNAYYRGQGVAQDYKKAAEYYQKAADAGDSTATNNLGYLYQAGLGVTKDINKALSLYKKAIDAGNADAMLAVANIYVEGIGVAKNENEVSRWILKAAEVGNSNAMFMLAVMYFQGIYGLSKNIDKAIYWLKESAVYGNDVAMNDVGMFYTNGEHGFKINPQTAFNLFKKAAGAGNAQAMCNLGIMYYKGESVSKDYFEAFKLIKTAAETGDSRAYSWLGTMYRCGEGVSKSYSEALNWFRKAADNGDGYSMNAIAAMYRYGQGVRKNHNTALTWYGKAIDAGVESARTAKAELEAQIESKRERKRQYARDHSSSRKSSNFGLVAGGAIGFAVGGPLGALAGGFIGSFFED